jgi:hypothetical protein
MMRVKIAGPRSDLPRMPAVPKALKFNEFEGVPADVKMVGWRD